MERFLVVGSGGREAALASRLAEDSVVCALMDHENPMIIKCAGRSGGSWAVGDTRNPAEVAGFAEREHVDYAFVSSDEPLAAGVVDGLLDRGIMAVGATRAAARVEWDKAWAAGLVNRVCPEMMPDHRIVMDADGLDGAVSWFEAAGKGVVVKPQGLTGGKGVKVMGPHLETYGDCRDYAVSLLEERPGESVLLVERLEGIEFTIMGMTDGVHLVMSPASYDYPYRFAGDAGPGTGGMGCFTGPAGALPFMTDDDLDGCRRAMDLVLAEMRRLGLRFTGVLNGGFFLTRDGLKFMEFNARFGDPEGLSILQVLRTPFSDVVRMMWHGTLTSDVVKFEGRASVVKYLVGPEYPAAGRRIAFSINEGRAAKVGAGVWTASCVRDGGSLVSLGRSRAAAVGALAGSIREASETVEDVLAASETGGLEHRSDIGTGDGLRELAERAAGLRAGPPGERPAGAVRAGPGQPRSRPGPPGP